MGNPFEGLAIDFTDRAFQELVELLAAHFELREEIRDVVRSAGVKAGQIRYDLPAYLLWPEVLAVAHRQELHEAVLAEVKKRARPLASRVDALLSGRPALTARPAPAAGDVWRGGLQAMTGSRSTLLDIRFLTKGIEAAAAVCLLTMQRARDGAEWLGTGFLVEPDLVLTNQHVLFSDMGAGPRADWVRAVFHYETGKQPVSVTGDAGTIVGDADHDWAVVRLKRPVDGVVPLRLGTESPLRREDPAFIIQHPGGGPKQIGLYRNEIRYFDDRVVQYLTDTRSGSSGSPVFNKDWEVIALHHRWIEADGSADGGAGHPDAAAGGGARRPAEVRNQGIFIARVVEGLREVRSRVSGAVPG